MDNIELYINGSLCDTGKNFGVRLKRQLISPAELNTKDAQVSYSVTLPITRTNDRVFSYSSVEEIKGKFNRMYLAELIINSYRVFSGSFRLSEINKEGYKGNLVVPVAKTVKDVFGDSKLTDNAPLEIEFKNFVEYVNYWNGKAKLGEVPPCIFPYVLYGLLPKSSSSADGNTYTDRDLWDNTVRLDMRGLPPSINVLNVLKHIFESKNYTLTGSAFDDIRLSSLYMSYKNEVDYIQPWNYGGQAKMRVVGDWSNIKDMKTSDSGLAFERSIYNGTDTDGRELYGCDMMISTNSYIAILEDQGANIFKKMTTDQYGRTWTNAQMVIPTSGFYKVNLHASMRINSTKNLRVSDDRPGGTGIQFLGGYSDDASNGLDKRRFEIKVLRSRGRSEVGMTNARIDGVFNRDNLPQNETFDENNSPKYYPQILTTPSGKPCQIQMIDLAQNPNFVVGLSWGKKGDRGYAPVNPKDNANVWAQVMAAKPSLSFDVSQNGTPAPRLAINAPGYWRWGRVENTDTLDWGVSTRFEQEVINSPENWARRGVFNGSSYNPDWTGDGSVSAIVWLDAGEILTVANISDEGRHNDNGSSSSRYGMVIHEMVFDLSITPFRIDADWLKVNYEGDGTGVMDWDDPVNFQTDEIDLVKFLPNDVRTDEFIENFCKAFNLKLSQTGTTGFSLDVKQTKKSKQNNFIDIDTLASVKDKSNQPLGLPYAYSIGFTINTDEEGYVKTKEDGGGTFYTGAIEGNVIEQKSNFSYNWFKDIRKEEERTTEPVVIPLPVISKAEVWTSDLTYPEAMSKRYTNLAQRFWYFDGLLNDLGVTFKFGQSLTPLNLAKVTNALPGLNTLSYKDENNTILNNYFSLLTDANSHYTLIECYLQPNQYEEIGKGAKVRFNGDMYYVAGIDGYDPLNRNKTTLELIRLI